MWWVKGSVRRHTGLRVELWRWEVLYGASRAGGWWLPTTLTHLSRLGTIVDHDPEAILSQALLFRYLRGGDHQVTQQLLVLLGARWWLVVGDGCWWWVVGGGWWVVGGRRWWWVGGSQVLDGAAGGTKC